MNIAKSTLIFIASLLSVSGIYAQESKTGDIDYPVSFTDVQKNIIKTNIVNFPSNTQLSIAVIREGETDYLGLKNNDSIYETIDNKDAVFQIGSITKVMTSTLLANIVLANEVSLSTEISELLGYSLLNNSKITLQQLSNHTSGMKRMPDNFIFAQMKDANNPYMYYDEEMLKTWLTQYMTKDLNQEVSNYSNLGAALLAHGLTKKLSKSYEELLQEQIFQKLEMTSSSSKLKNVSSKLITGLDANGEPNANWEFDVMEGAGSVFSSISDLEKYTKAVMSQKNEALNLQTKPTFEVSTNMSIGLGWHIIYGKGGNTYYWHNGGTSGYTSSLLIDIERKIATMVLSNVSAFHPNTGNIDNITFDLMKSFN